MSEQQEQDILDLQELLKPYELMLVPQAALRRLLARVKGLEQKRAEPSVPVSVIEHWREYWNGDRNEGAMWDALNYLMDHMDDEIAKAKEQA